MNDPIKNLEQLVNAVEQAGANIAPSYLEYMQLAFAVSNNCGEVGRPLFHRLCRLSEKYRYDEAEEMFSKALAKGNGRSTLGTVWHLAETAGVNTKKLSFRPPLPSHTHAREKMSDNTAGSRKDDAAGNEKDVTAGNGTSSQPSPGEGGEIPLPPPFPEYRWPRFLQRIIDCGESKAQRDILLLGALTVLGSTLNKLVCFNYGHKDHYPCLQTFVLAPPASGKGVLAWVRQLAAPIHEELLSSYLQKMKTYRMEKAKWDGLGKERAKYPEPEMPKMKLFFIAGDNSGTGMQENLMDGEGTGLICESEADTVSTAIGADYGHWSHMLRKAFDHDTLSYNRRTNHEYRECLRLLLALLLSGTPAQLCPLIPSPENGLFSRQLFYYMPAIREWVSQFDLEGADYGRIFRQWGERWKAVLDAVKAETGSFRLRLSAEQQEEFNDCLSRIFSHAGTAHGNHMRSTVARIAINVCRILCIVAWLRSLEDIIESPEYEPAEPAGTADTVKPSDSVSSLTRKLLSCPGLFPGADTPRENVADGMVSSFILTVGKEDFEAVLSLVEPLYRHSCHALTFLPDTDVNQRRASARELFLSSLPIKFTRREAAETARCNGISENTLDTLLKRMSDKGVIESVGRGLYRFSSRVRVKGKEG